MMLNAWFHSRGLFLLLLFALWGCRGPVIIDDEPSSAEDTPLRDSVPIVHEGTYASPYTIAEAQSLRRSQDIWVEGYVVGSVSGSMKKGCDYTAAAVTQANILLADTFLTGHDDDYLYCLPIALPGDSDEREALNLYDHPEHFHRKLRLLGDLTLYYSVVGVRNVETYVWGGDDVDEDDNEDVDDDDENENENDDVDEDDEHTPVDPDQTNCDTLNISQSLECQNQGEQPYIRGVIVGYYNNRSICLHPKADHITSPAQTNVVLADSANVADASRVIIVELPNNTALRRDVNLYDHPENLYRTLVVKGLLQSYKSTEHPGCMSTLSALGDDEDYYFSLE